MTPEKVVFSEEVRRIWWNTLVSAPWVSSILTQSCALRVCTCQNLIFLSKVALEIERCIYLWMFLINFQIVNIIVSWFYISIYIWHKQQSPAIEYFTCIVPETTPVQKTQVLVVVILQGHFLLLLLEAGKIRWTMDNYLANKYNIVHVKKKSSIHQ